MKMIFRGPDTLRSDCADVRISGWLHAVIVAVLTIAISACAHRPLAPSKLRQVHSIQFRNCEITDRRDGKNVCECGNIEWMRDAKAGRWIALCLK